MSDSVNICPSCNYSEKNEAGFQVCPRCGLIVSKYVHRIKQGPAEIQIIHASTFPSHPTLINRVLKITAAVVFSALGLLIVAVLTNRYIQPRSGTIIWAKEYYTECSESIPSFVHGMTVANDFLYLVGSYGRSDTQTGLWSIQKRYASDGMLVPAFGEGGLVKSAFGPREDYANGVAVDSHYVYVIGTDRTPWGDDRTKRMDFQWRIEKRGLSDGSLADGFGEHGVVTSNLTDYYEKPEAVIIDGNYMYVAGTEVTQGNDYQWRIEKRLLSDGLLASGFGIEGVVRSNPNATEGYAGSERVNAMAIGDGYIYVVGVAYNSPRTDTCWRIEKRRLDDGTSAEEFGTEGFVASNPGPGSDEPFGIAIDEKSMFVAGFDTSNAKPLSPQWRIEKRSLSDGALVKEFGKGGIVTINGRIGMANGIVLEHEPTVWEKIVNFDISDNQRCIYVVGVDKDERSGIHQWRIEKRKMNNGALSLDFGKNGVVNFDPGVELRQARLIAADTDYLYVSGGRIGSHTSMMIKIKK